MQAPQRLGAARAPAATGPTETEIWTLEIDSQRPWRNARACDGTDGYSAGSWVEVDVPHGFIPAEIQALNVYVSNIAKSSWYLVGATIGTQIPSSSFYGGSTAAATLPYYRPSYAIPNPATGPTATNISQADTMVKLVMLGRGRSSPARLLSTSGEQAVTLASWSIWEERAGAVVTQGRLESESTHTSSAICTIGNPSGETLRFEIRGTASDAMLCVRGCEADGTQNPFFGLATYRATIQLVPARTAQYGSTDSNTATQFA
jgi:hypothetical protein